jgi:putative oxygen-independent coproporphyrinogen III oxidase
VTSHHLYLHVPFCRLVCAYCDFVTVGGRRAELPRYVDALLTEMAMRPANGELTTIYFGGGTPSLLPASAVEHVLRTAMDRWNSRPREVTLEANPSQREAPDWAGLRLVGVNRISLGLQSLRETDLRTLARGHTAAEGHLAYVAARSAGFENVSIDLIYGIPGQSLTDWREGLMTAIALEPDHLSLYALQLALAPDEWAATPRAGALRWRRRLAGKQDDDVAADQYRLAEELLDAAGYRHYELSSWSRPGRDSQHNAAYWDRRAYTGIGAGAHSYDGVSIRSWNTRDLDSYLGHVEAGERPAAGMEHLSESSLAFEAVALGLRRVDGFSRGAFAAEFGEDPLDRFEEAVERGIANGLLEIHEDLIRLSPEGRLLANEVLVAFLPEAGTRHDSAPLGELATAR